MNWKCSVEVLKESLALDIVDDNHRSMNVLCCGTPSLVGGAEYTVVVAVNPCDVRSNLFIG